MLYLHRECVLTTNTTKSVAREITLTSKVVQIKNTEWIYGIFFMYINPLGAHSVEKVHFLMAHFSIERESLLYVFSK